MTKYEKTLYILVIVFFALAVIGGGVGVVGLIATKLGLPVWLSVIGIVLLFGGFGAGAITEIFLQRSLDKRKRREDKARQARRRH